MNERKKLISGSAEPFEPIVLMSRETVRNDLDVTDEVAADLDRQVERYSSTFRRLAACRMPAEEVERELAEARSSITKDIERILSSGQVERLEQIRWQVQGVAALLEPAMIDRLQLSDKQKANIESARASKEDLPKDFPESASQPPLADAPVKTRQLVAPYPNWNAGTLSVLSEEQIQRLVEALGSPLPAIRNRDEGHD